MVYGGYGFWQLQDQRSRVRRPHACQFIHIDQSSISLVGSILENDRSELSVPADLEFVEGPNTMTCALVRKVPKALPSIEGLGRRPVSNILNSGGLFPPHHSANNHGANQSLPSLPDDEFTRRQLQGMVSHAPLHNTVC